MWISTRDGDHVNTGHVIKIEIAAGCRGSLLHLVTGETIAIDYRNVIEIIDAIHDTQRAVIAAAAGFELLVICGYPKNGDAPRLKREPIIAWRHSSEDSHDRPISITPSGEERWYPWLWAGIRYPDGQVQIFAPWHYNDDGDRCADGLRWYRYIEAWIEDGRTVMAERDVEREEKRRQIFEEVDRIFMQARKTNGVYDENGRFLGAREDEENLIPPEQDIITPEQAALIEAARLKAERRMREREADPEAKEPDEWPF